MNSNASDPCRIPPHHVADITNYHSQPERKTMLESRRLGVIVASTLISAGALLGISAAPAGAAAASPQTAAATTATHTSSFPGRNVPYISFAECTGETTTWVDLDIVTASGLQDWCYGGTGTWQFYSYDNDVRYFCSGNNSGVYVYIQNGVHHNFTFGPGRLIAFAANVRAYSLSIGHWSGGDTCTS
jgi:hypothetical protein